MKHLQSETEGGIGVSMPLSSNKKYDADMRLRIDANARLIAAAPDLYAALHALWHDNQLPSAGGHYERACAALAKARGEHTISARTGQEAEDAGRADYQRVTKASS